MKKISVIIPMYNTEAFIEQCISSVINQTYSNWEVIVIDDGSADKSREVCREVSLTDDRIRLYSQEHRGISYTRNHGLEIASSEYIFFLDSDDAIHPLLFEELIRQAQEYSLDIAFCGFVEVENREMERILREPPIKNERFCWEFAEGPEAEEWFHVKYKRELFRLNGLIKRECIETLRFDENLTMGEDTLFLYQLFRRQIRAASFPCAWYYYRIHPTSITHTKAAVHNGYHECERMIRDHEYERGNHEYALIRETGIIMQLNKNYAICRKQGDKEGCKRIRGMAAAERKNALFKDIKLNIRLRHICCFHCYPLYVPLNYVIFHVWKWKNAGQK